MSVWQVEAVDADECDAGRLVYRVGGDGAGQPSVGEDAFFTINARTGDLIQLKVSWLSGALNHTLAQSVDPAASASGSV